MMSVLSPPDARKLIEALLSDLRQLSTEAKKKHNHVKEAAESGVVRVRNISTASGEGNLLTNLRVASNELLHPLILACATRQTRLVQIALLSIQRLVQHRVLEASCANVVVSELWGLVEAECEELRVLQTVPPLVSADLLVTGNTLAKCIVMCFRMHFSKDPVVINAASAAVRQLVGCVFERVIQEDGVFNTELTVVASQGGRPLSKSAPPTLRPCAADAYLLFKDLCLLINAKPSVWLVGIHEMTRTLGLELIESILKSYPSVFFKHQEFCDLLKSEVCPLVIKLFSPSLKSTQVSSQHMSSRPPSNINSPNDRPYFPIAMRLVRIILCIITLYHHLLPTECEIFLSSLVKFVDVDRRGWQRALSLEALHRIIIRQDIVKWLCENFDARSNSAKVLEQLSHCIFCVIQQSFMVSKLCYESDMEPDAVQPKGASGFYFCNVWYPHVEQLSAKKSILLDSLEKHEAGVLPDGYVVSRAASVLTDFVQAVNAAVDAITIQGNGDKNNSNHIAKTIFASCQPNLLCGLSFLLSASTDETVTDQLLCGLSTLVSVGCKLKVVPASLNCLFVLCCTCLPSATYLSSYAAVETPQCDGPLPELVFDSPSSLQEVVASGTPCPSPLVPPDKWNDQVTLTSRNLQASRILLSSICGNASTLDELWYFCLLTCQHIAWLLGIRPSATGTFSCEKTEIDQQGNCGNVTTTALSEIPTLAALFDKVACASVSLSDGSFLTALEALMRLSDENIAVAATGRESSLYPIAMLLRLSCLNLHRQQVFWDHVTAHFVKICGHTTASLRDWAAVALSSIIKQAFKAKTSMTEAEHQLLTLTTLRLMCSIHHSDVQRRQLDCLMALLQTDGAQLKPDMWQHVIYIVAAVVDEENCCDESLVRQGYLGLRLIAADFLQSIPFECISVLVEAVARYGKQAVDHNISLSALTQLWTISDFVFRKSEIVGADASEKVWLVLYTCLSELCVDVRPSVRKSACQTFLQTIASHGHALRITTWNHMIWQIIMPLLDRVRVQTRSASTERASGTLLMHHSRDTQQKQWTETCIHTLSAASKIFITQRKALLALENFGSAWEALLTYLEWAACYQNAELSLSAIKSFQEVLLGKVSMQTLDINIRERASSMDNSCDEVIPYLPLPQWMEAWNVWQRISRGLARIGVSATTSEGASEKPYIPGPSHITTLLHIFPPLFGYVAHHIDIDDLKAEHLPSVLESLVNVPIPSEQVPFIMQSSQSHMSPTQEAVLEAIRSIYSECISGGGPLRDVLPDQIQQLLRFSAMAVKTPSALRLFSTTASGQKDYRDWALQWIIPFAETALRMAIEFFSFTAAFPEIIRSLVVVDIVKFLGEPLYMKYSCISPTTWKLASSSLMTVLRIAVPLARQQVEHFSCLWPVICDTLEKFLFSPNVCPRLAADERKRDELAECQVVELVRSELLLYSSCLPSSMVQRLISILNRGSISQLDPTDVLASDSHAQRVELARTCFDALLSTSSEGNGRLGNVAIASLLQRCSEVMNDFVRDWNSIGDLRLPRGRIAEITSALQAVDSLISRLAREPTQSELYSQLVSLYPNVVEVVSCTRSDSVLESQLITTLKSYQTLLLLQVVPKLPVKDT